MNKLKAIWAIITAGEYVILTDSHCYGSYKQKDFSKAIKEMCLSIQDKFEDKL